MPGELVRAGLTEAASSVTSDATAVADGAPDDFEESAIAGLTVLATLPSGTVRYDGETWHIEATPETALQAGEARTAFDAAGLDASGWTYGVEAPPAPPVEALPVIADYAWSAEKQSAGTIALSGYVPTEGLRRVLALRAGDAAVNEQALGSGAPYDFPLNSLAAIDALKLLDEGTVAFADGQWSLSGRSHNPGAPDAVTAALGERAASWNVAVTAPPPPPPVANPFVWSATKAADGSVAFSGYVSTPELKRFTTARAATVASDTTELASGAPEGFMPDVIAALDALAKLESGTVSFDGTSWSLTGAPASAATRDASLAALGGAATPADPVVNRPRGAARTTGTCRRGRGGHRARDACGARGTGTSRSARHRTRPATEPEVAAAPPTEPATEPEVAATPPAEPPVEAAPEVTAETRAPAEPAAVAETPLSRSRQQQRNPRSSPKHPSPHPPKRQSQPSRRRP